MYKVFFQGKEYAKVPTFEDSVALALSIHRASNVEHVIGVFDVEKDKEVVTFTRPADV